MRKNSVLVEINKDVRTKLRMYCTLTNQNQVDVLGEIVTQHVDAWIKENAELVQMYEKLNGVKE